MTFPTPHRTIREHAWRRAAIAAGGLGLVALGTSSSWAATPSFSPLQLRSRNDAVQMWGGESLQVLCHGTATVSRNNGGNYVDHCTRPVQLSHKTTTTTVATPRSVGHQCTSSPSGGLPRQAAYHDPEAIDMSNGYDTYVNNDMWAANSGTSQTICASSPSDWFVTANMRPTDYTGVQTYPDVQQLMNDWTGSGWNGNGISTNTPVSALTSLTSSYATLDPSLRTGDWEAAYDIWTTTGQELMIWVATSSERRATNGAKIINRDVSIGAHTFTYQNYNGALPQLVLNTNETSGTIHLLAAFKYWESIGVLSAHALLSQIQFGWEICNTAGKSLTFRLTDYSLSGS